MTDAPRGDAAPIRRDAQSTGRSEAHLRAERAARTSYGRLLALLAARLRDVTSAEDALAEAFGLALETWPRDGVPENPDGWLLTAARRRLIDGQRHDRMVRAKGPDVARQRARVAEGEFAADGAARLAMEELLVAGEEEGRAIPDERLSMLFLCAHPALDEGIHTPLMLQCVLGLQAEQIASAFVMPPSTMAQRLVRAKQRIKECGIRFGLSAGVDEAERAARMQAVLRAVYAAYTAGSDQLLAARGTDDGETLGVAEEAVWLGRELLRLAPEEPEVSGLLALMLHHRARELARRDGEGRFVPLDEQDVRRWDGALMAEAESVLRQAAALGRPGRFQLEAAIQSAHAARAHTGVTDWPAIVGLYGALLQLAPSLGAAVAHACARAALDGPKSGLALLDDLAKTEGGGVLGYQPYWAARAHMLRGLGDRAQSAAAYERAIGLCSDPAVRAFLLARRADLGLA